MELKTDVIILGSAHKGGWWFQRGGDLWGTASPRSACGIGGDFRAARALRNLVSMLGARPMGHDSRP